MGLPTFKQMKSLRVLVVDDDNFALQIIRHMIYQLGVGQIKDAFNGEHAIEIINKEPVDILITDIQMPKMNGLELLQQVRTGMTKAPRDLPVIAVTSFTETAILGSTLALDVNGFLAKPLKPAWVQEKVNEALSEKISLREVEDYTAVETSLEQLNQDSGASKQQKSEAVSASKKSPDSEEIAAEKPAETNKVFIRDLKPGMCIKGDLRLKDGTLLLSEGYKITKTTINRLHDLQDTLLSDAIPIISE